MACQNKSVLKFETSEMRTVDGKMTGGFRFTMFAVGDFSSKLKQSLSFCKSDTLCFEQ
jgi:hypothetical protein